MPFLDLLYLLTLCVSAVASILFTCKTSEPAYKILRIYLIISFIGECVMAWMVKMYPGRSNSVYYNYYMPFSVIIYSLAYYFKIGKKDNYKLIFYFIWLANISVFAWTMINNESGQFNVFYFVVTAISLITICLLFFVHIYRQDGIIYFWKENLFYITVGTLLFNLSLLPHMSVWNFLISKNWQIDWRQINKIMSVLLYAGFALDYYQQWKKITPQQ